MIAGVGLDATEVARMRRVIGRFGSRFTQRVFTKAEREWCDSRPRPEESYAARFAAKEAVMKALGSGWGSGVRFKDIEVVRKEHGAPRVVLRDGAKERAFKLRVSRVHLSISHEAGIALAQAVAETRFRVLDSE